MNGFRETLSGRPMVWTVGLVLGAIGARATQTLFFPLFLVAAAIWVGRARSWRASAAGSLLVGLGVTWSWLTVAAASHPQPWIWFVISPAAIVAGVGAAWVGRRELKPPDREASRGRWLRLPMKAIVGAAIVLALPLTWTGLPAGPGDYALPAHVGQPWFLGTTCAGVGLDAVVHGSPDDPRIAWLENRLMIPAGAAGQRMDVEWPTGFRARFTPNLEILDGWGNVVLREGDAVGGACQTGEFNNGVLFLTPPFE